MEILKIFVTDLKSSPSFVAHLKSKPKNIQI